MLDATPPQFGSGTPPTISVPLDAVQRKPAWGSGGQWMSASVWIPTTVLPSVLIAVAMLLCAAVAPHMKVNGSPLMVPPTHRKAWPPDVPATIVPKALTPAAKLVVWPGRKPMPWKLAPCANADVGAAAARAMTAQGTRRLPMSRSLRAAGGRALPHADETIVMSPSPADTIIPAKERANKGTVEK